MTWVAYVACVEAKTDEHNFLAGKYEGKRPLGMRRRSWNDNIEIKLP